MKFIIGLVFVVALDILMAQMLAWSLSSYGVNSGLFQDWFTVVTASAIITAAVRAAK